MSTMQKIGLIGGALFVALVVASLFGNSGNAGKGASTKAGEYPSAAETTEYPTAPQRPVSTSDDWLGAVCRPGTILQGAPETLRNAIGGYVCGGYDGPIYVGVYDRSLMRDNDLAIFQGRAHYAEMVDEDLDIWLFVAMGAKRTLEPLRQFGFIVA